MGERKPPKCQHCYTRLATCLGQYEGALAETYACDTCCAHGCEDGHCTQLYERTDAGEPLYREPLTTRNR